MSKINRLLYGILLMFIFLSSITYAADPLVSREPYGPTEYSLEFSKWNNSQSYNGGRDSMSSTTYSSGGTIEVSNIKTDPAKPNNWLITYKASGSISAYCYSADSSYSADARITINGSSIEGNRSDSSGSNSYRVSMSYDGSEKTISVYKGENPMKIYVKVRTYSRTYLISTTREEVKVINMNNSPKLTAQTDRNYMNGKDGQSVTISGKAWDIEQDSLTITAELNGVTKTKIINSPNAVEGQDNDYALTFSLSEYPDDIISTLTVTVKDYYGDITNISFTIYIDRSDPEVSTQNDVKIKGGEYVSVEPTEQSDIYLLVNDRSYALYSDVWNAIIENKGAQIGNCSTKTNLSVPSTIKEGSYRLFAVDNGKNVSEPSTRLVMVDNSLPEKVRAVIEGDEIILIYGEVLKPTVPLKDDFVFPRENIVSSSVCIIANEDRVDYEFIFDDYETDPKYTDRFVFTAFDNSMFTNTNGTPDIVGKTAVSKNIFCEVGKYNLEYQAQDTPVAISENRFDNYRKWSNKNNVELLVHRRPIADLVVHATIHNENWMINSTVGNGYDLDHIDMSNKGIIEEKYEWKNASSPQFIVGKMPNGLPSKIDGKDTNYIIKYMVKDVEGAWSEPKMVILNRSLTFDAKLTTEKSQPLTRVSTDQNLITFDAVTTYPFNVHLELALFDNSGTNQILGTKTINYTESVTGSKSGTKILWDAINYYIPKNTAENWYTFKATAVADDGQKITKEWKVYLINNTPPTVKIHSTNPSFIYEGDNVAANILLYDVDQDTLNVTVQLFKNGTSIKTNTYSVSPIGSTYNPLVAPLIIAIENGSYEIRVDVEDGNGGTASDALTFTTNALSITGQVNHYPKWDENRIKYNQSKTGTDNSPRTYNTFWAGERFMVSADTTTIHPSSTVQASSVQVEILGEPYSMYLTSSNKTAWSGELWDNTMIHRWGTSAPENLTFRFTVTYSNGLVKTDDVAITIDDRENYWQYHRKF